MKFFLVTNTPDSEGLFLFRVDGISARKGEKLAGEVRRPSSRGQKRQNLTAGLHSRYQGGLTILGGRLESRLDHSQKGLRW